MSLRFAIATLTGVVVICTPPRVAEAYLKAGATANGTATNVSWTATPVHYFVSERGVPGVTPTQLREAVDSAFTTWHEVPSASIAFEFSGVTEASPLDEDNTNTLGFEAQPDLERTLAATNYVVDTRTGAILEADVFFNSAFPWSVAPGGEQGRYDLQSIATHEIGHFLGLGHSALGETEIRPTGGRRVLAKQAIMFPIAFPAGNIDDRTPTRDDAAGLGEIYSSASFKRQFGQAAGRVTLNGRGLFGAHVTVFNPANGDLVGGFCLDAQGNFVIGGLKPGLYVVRAEPLDDADLTSFFGGSTVVDIDFTPAYSTRLVAVPAGGSSVPIEIKVSPK